MSDEQKRDEETEDVEAHRHWESAEPTEDDGDDVEAHRHHASGEPVEGDGDDVDAHIFIHGRHKA
jgi:hypothetical protein